MNVYHIFLYTGIAGLILTIIEYFIRKPEFIFYDLIRNWIGALFIFSGIVKAIDPLGTSYKISEYFEVLHLNFLEHYTVLFSVGMIVLEIVLGVAMIIGYKSKWTGWITLLLMIFFTFLTGYTYLSGWDFHKWVFDAGKMKVTSCGCFGDFIKLEPRVSFYKDIILSIGSIILLLAHKKIKLVFRKSLIGHALITLATVVSIWFCLRNYMWNEPIVDFRAYKIGTDIKDAMTPKKAPVVEMAFKYKSKKTGEQKTFSLKELPKDLENWEFVDRDDKVLDPGVPAKITDLGIQNEQGEDVTQDFLNDPNYNFWVVCYDIGKTNKTALEKNVNPVMDAAQKAGYIVAGLSHNSTEAFMKETASNYPFYFCDDVPLKTMGRGNPLILLLRNGVIIDKWHWNQLPDFNEIAAKDLKK